eukprot:2657930-Prymnesium_polylepis.1
MEPVRADRGAIHATTNAYGQMVSFREIARDLVRLREWGCAHERYRPARAQLRSGRGVPFIGTLYYSWPRYPVLFGDSRPRCPSQGAPQQDQELRGDVRATPALCE